MEKVIDSKNITPREFIDRYRDFLKEDGCLYYEKMFSKMLTELFYPLTSGPSKEDLPVMWDAVLSVYRDYDNIRRSYDVIKENDEFKKEFAFDNKRMSEYAAVLERSGIDIEEYSAIIVPITKVGDYFRGIVIMVKQRSKSYNDGEDWKASLDKKDKGEFKENIVDVNSAKEIKKAMDSNQIARCGFCSIGMDGAKCAEVIEKDITAQVRGVRVDEEMSPSGNCAVCGKKAKAVVYIARSY